ncbi:MAG: MotA/TolQ/ExbB proton channel family protein, partial [Clostridia bacterium]|nr:MotA/TolQ/ExbB proton channel family protein [Clostridia bacterium]
TSRKKVSVDLLEELIYKISKAGSSEELMDIIKNAKIYENQKVVLVKVLRAESLTLDTRKTLARKLIEAEESKLAKSIERTDIVTRIGPTLGLMGTLIPMGPGLAALGAGDVNTLANAIIVAFDTTVVGIGAGAVGYFVSKVRRRWYEEDLSNLDALIDALLDKLSH